MNDIITKQIVSNIANDESTILKDSIVKNKNLNENDRKQIIEKIESLAQIKTCCLPYIKMEGSIEPFIAEVGIANVCRYFNNLCSQYARLQGYNYPESEYSENAGDLYDSSALKQDYILEFAQETKKVPLSTRSGDPSEYLNQMVGVYSEPTEEDKTIIANNFKDTASVLKSCVEASSDAQLPYYEGMSAREVRSSLNRLIENGKIIIESLMKKSQKGQDFTGELHHRR